MTTLTAREYVHVKPKRVSANTPCVKAEWLNVVTHLDPKYGGLSSSVPELDAAIAAASEFSVCLAGFCEGDEFFQPQPSAGVDVRHFLKGSRFSWQRRTEATTEFQALVARSAGVHVHGLWQPSTALAARTARRLGKPYVITAHGMLERWALANKKYKKAIYMALTERANLRGAACLHALTRAEAEDYRRLGLRNPIAIIPNGVRIPEEVSSRPFLDRFPKLKNKRLILFLGRIHYKKGLDILIDAWARVGRNWPGAHLVLAGPDFENTQRQIEQRISALAMEPRVTFTGMLSGSLKWSALAACDVFVLPSYSEGLSVSVLEAMGTSRPVVITEQCNLPEVAQKDCGWVIKATQGALEQALKDALSSSSSDRGMQGEHGRRLVAARYGWDTIGRQMGDVYRWLTGGAFPAAVEMLREGEPV